MDIQKYQTFTFRLVVHLSFYETCVYRVYVIWLCGNMMMWWDAFLFIYTVKTLDWYKTLVKYTVNKFQSFNMADNQRGY